MKFANIKKDTYLCTEKSKSHMNPLLTRTSQLTLRILLLLALFGCERDIHIDYHSVDPITVVQAAITNEGCNVRVSTTQHMDDNIVSDKGVEGATIVISSGDSISQTLTYTRQGYYTAPLRGTPGTDYTIDVLLDGRHYTSTSTMQPMPQMNSFRFVWKKIMGQRLLFGDLRLQDIPAHTSYYFMHIYRNGIGYRWAVMRDNQSPDGELQQLFSFIREDDDDDDDSLHDGDQLRLEIRAIDRRAYDYLYSMQVMNGTGTNPIANFTGGCLGYFSAYSQFTHYCVYHPEEVESEV
jgi:hypothetical protein